jgi:hypothetical protein
MSLWTWSGGRMLRAALRNSPMKEEPSDKFGPELIRAVSERSTPAESVDEGVDTVEHLLTTADRLGIRDQALDDQARATFLAWLQDMGNTHRWRLPWKSKRRNADGLQATTQDAPPALPPGSAESRDDA